VSSHVVRKLHVHFVEVVHACDDPRRVDWIEGSLFRSSSNCYLRTAPTVPDNEIMVEALGPSLGTVKYEKSRFLQQPCWRHVLAVRRSLWLSSGPSTLSACDRASGLCCTVAAIHTIRFRENVGKEPKWEHQNYHYFLTSWLNCSWFVFGSSLFWDIHDFLLPHEKLWGSSLKLGFPTCDSPSNIMQPSVTFVAYVFVYYHN
jgi:hypothetical protein